MAADCFLDTNILVYAAYPHKDEQRKQAVALDLIAERQFAISGQVMLEFLNSVTRRRRPGLPLATARIWLEEFARRDVIRIGPELIFAATDLAERYKIVFWDAAILAAAEQAGARTLFTEDLNDGQLYGAVQVVNPFKSTSH